MTVAITAETSRAGRFWTGNYLPLLTTVVSDGDTTPMSPTGSLPEHRQLRVAVVAAGLQMYKVAKRLDISETRLSGMLSGRLPLTDEWAARIRAAIRELAA